MPDVRFLRNVSGCLPYLYLVDYVVHMCESWWQLPASQLDILDWGCGSGATTYLLSRRNVRPTSVDVETFGSKRPLLEASGCPLIVLDHDWKLPFADQSFHAILSFGVLEHVPNDAASLREIYRVLRPGGLFLCFNLPRAWSWIMRLVYLLGNHYHDRLYTSRSVKKLLAQSNLKLVEIWRRQIFPKNNVHYPFPYQAERLDQWLCEHTPLGYLATSLEFVAYRE